MSRTLTILIAIDVFVSRMVTLGNCKPGETISAAAWSLEQDGKWQGRLFRPLIDALLFFDKNHCAESHIGDLRRAQATKELT